MAQIEWEQAVLWEAAGQVFAANEDALNASTQVLSEDKLEKYRQQNVVAEALTQKFEARDELLYIVISDFSVAELEVLKEGMALIVDRMSGPDLFENIENYVADRVDTDREALVESFKKNVEAEELPNALYRAVSDELSKQS